MGPCRLSRPHFRNWRLQQTSIMHFIGKRRSSADSALTSMPVRPISSPEAESIKKSMFSCGHTSMGQILLWIPGRCVTKGTVDMLYIAMHNTMHSTMHNTVHNTMHSTMHNTVHHTMHSTMHNTVHSTMHSTMHNHTRSAANKISPGMVIMMYISCTPQK